MPIMHTYNMYLKCDFSKASLKLWTWITLRITDFCELNSGKKYNQWPRYTIYVRSCTKHPL